jgi:anti-sigma factor RsiW
MAHVDDGTLNALLDGELREAEATAIRAHLATCAECGVRFEEAQRFLAAAANLLDLLAVPATKEPPAVAPEVPAAGEAPPRRVSKTAKEVAVDIDGATHQSPAILPNVPREDEVVPRPRSPSSGAELRPLFEGRTARPVPAPHRRPDWATLAWAASVVLALGVGYLANEVRHYQPLASGNTQALAPAADTQSARAARPAAARAARRPDAADKAAADAFAATPPRPKPRGALSRKAMQPAPADATPLALTSGAADNAGYRMGGAATPVAPAAQRAAEMAGNLAAAAPAGAPAPAAREAVAAPLTRLPARPAFRLSDVDAAAARLSGTVRTLEGLSLENVKIGPGSLVPGAQPDRAVVRIVYTDPQGRRLQLDQQRLPSPRDTSREGRARAVPAVLGLTFGDTLSTTGPGNATRVRWLDPAGLWLSLSGSLPADSLRALLARVR